MEDIAVTNHIALQGFPVHSSAVHVPISQLPLDILFNAQLKRSFDLAVSILLALFVLTWLIPILALIIKLDSRGPVFFRQKRNGKGGEIFNCFKLRSMIVNRDPDIMPSIENDFRITKAGRILRRYHLDELPQIFNVILGHMSLIGPRPLMLHENLKYKGLWQEYETRHKVRPGITGLAQSLGCFGSTDNLDKIKERLSHDLYYINNWTFSSDLKIFWRTLRSSV